MILQVLFSVMRALDWKAFIMVHSEDTYGQEGARGVLDLTLPPGASARNPCPVDTIMLNSVDNAASYQRAVRKMLDLGVNGVVYFGTFTPLRKLMEAMQTIEGAGRLQFLMADGAFAGTLSYPFSKGLITASVSATSLPEFEDFWVSMDPENPPADSPNFQEYYVAAHECSVAGLIVDANVPECQTLSESERRNLYNQESYTESAVLAIYAYAKALKLAHEEKCGGAAGPCSDLMDMPSREFFTNYLKTLNLTFTEEERIVSFVGSNGTASRRLQFDQNGDIAHIGYDIWNVQEEDGLSRFVKVNTVNKSLIND